jgi:hypothetical protein
LGIEALGTEIENEQSVFAVQLETDSVSVASCPVAAPVPHHGTVGVQVTFTEFTTDPSAGAGTEKLIGSCEFAFAPTTRLNGVVAFAGATSTDEVNSTNPGRAIKRRRRFTGASGA